MRKLSEHYNQKQSLLQHPISVYSNFYSICPDELITFDNLEEYLLEDETIKEKRKFLIFSTIIEEGLEELGLSRCMPNFTTSPFFIVDIDTKKQEEIIALNKDGGLDNLYNFFKEDKNCVFVCHSSSGKGLRALYVIEGYYNIHCMLESNDVEYEKALCKYNFETFISYMKSNNFNNIETYLDKAFKKNYVQGTYTINKDYPYHFKKYGEFTYLTPETEQPTSTSIERVTYNNVPFEEDIYDWNTMYLQIDRHYIKGLGHNEILEWLSALQPIKNDDIVYKIFLLLKRSFVGNSYRKYVDGYEQFKKVISKTKFSKFNTNLAVVLKKHGIKIIKIKNENEKKDVFGRTYDYTYKYERYISELNDIDLSSDKIVMRSDAGSGKSHYILEYISNEKGIRIFAAPTNVLSDQVYDKCMKSYTNVVKFFGGKYENIPDECIVITNYANLSKLEKTLSIYNSIAKVLVLDEVHKVTDYALFKDKQYVFPVSNKTILMSATPEPFLMGEKDYMYLNFEKIDGIEKRDITLIRSSSKQQTRKCISQSIKSKYVDNKCDKKFVIFHNNKDINSETKFNFINSTFLNNLDVSIIDSKNKTEEYNSIIETGIIHKHILTTSLINDGVNILNNDIEDVFIIDNNTQSIFDIYQFCERFRNSRPNIYYFYDKGKYDDKDETIFDYGEFDINYKGLKTLSENCIKTINKNVSKYTISTMKVNYIFCDRGNYVVNKNQIKLHLYDSFKRTSRSNIFLMKKLFENYFNIYDEIFLIKEKEVKVKDNIDFLKDNIDRIIKYKRFGINPLWTIDEEISFNQSTMSIKKIMSRYYKLEKNELDYKDFDMFANSDNFKYEYRLAKITTLSTDLMKSKLDMAYLDSYNKMKNIVDNTKYLDEFKIMYEPIKEDLISTFIIDFTGNDIKSINKSLLDLGVKFRKLKEKGKETIYLTKIKNKK